jgi:uncharacterized protein YbjT (DUF2867 family)
VFHSRRRTLLALVAALVSAPAVALAEGVVIFGGTGATGLEIVKQLRAKQEPVTVVVRPTSNVEPLKALGLQTLVADAFDPAALAKALEGRRFRAAISTIGTTKRDSKERRPDYEANRNVIDAAKAAGIPRFVLITVIGTGDSAGSEPFAAGYCLRDVIALKDKAEQHLRASGLTYTIIRPGGLGDGAVSNTARLVEDPKAFSYIHRAELARLTVAALDDPKTYDRAFTAYDPEREHIWNLWMD